MKTAATKGQLLVQDNGASWQQDGGVHPHEANYLKLDISKAKARLGWQPRWPLAMVAVECFILKT